MNLRQGVGDAARSAAASSTSRRCSIADELTPSLAAQVDWTKVRGFATDAGSRTYHTAILARSLEVPAVVGLHDASRADPAGAAGRDRRRRRARSIIDPDDGRCSARVARHADDRRPAAAADAERRRPATTADGVRDPARRQHRVPRRSGGGALRRRRRHRPVSLGVPADRAPRRRRRAKTSSTRSIAACSRAWRRAPVTIRTFDVDEDQLASRSARPGARRQLDCRRGARQPAGLRGLRLSLARPELFRTQLRALLRAARHGSLRIMFPFVSGVEQVREARAHRRRGGGGARRAAASRVAARADRRDDRDAGGGLHRRSAGARSRLLHDRHQRSDSVLPGGRSRRRARLAAVRAAASGDPARDRDGAPRRGAAADSGVALRRDGVGSGAADAARRARPDASSA